MPTLFVLLFKINLVLIIFAAAYYLVLRKLTFYAINRAFLMFGILFSSAYPFINLSSLSDRYKKISSIVPQINQGVSEYIKQDNIPAYWQAANILFWVGALIMASRLALQFISLYRIHKGSEPGLASDYKIRILTDDVGPFSFWQTIYINPKLHEKQDLDNILKHERVHVEEWHTLDIILAEVSLVFYWFNPGVWLMKRAVRENIEFITDAKILKKGIDKKTYQYSLLHTGQLVPAMAIVNNFNLSDLKKRIKMMNARRSSPLALSRYLFLLPLLLITTLAFTITRKHKPEKFVPVRQSFVTAKPSFPALQANTLNKKKPAKNKITPSVSNQVKRDTSKRVITFQAFDVHPDSSQGFIDVLPEPYPGDRIKMITVRRSSAEGGGGTISLKDTLNANPKNVFIVHREGDKTPAPPLMNIRNMVIRSHSPEFDGNVVAKFLLNGKEITKEEFSKLAFRDSSGTKLGKKLMIRVEKGSIK